MAKIKNGELVFLTTFTLFTVEALFHYNIGKKGETEGDKLDFHLPEKEEWIKVLGTVAVFAFLNAKLISYLRKN